MYIYGVVVYTDGGKKLKREGMQISLRFIYCYTLQCVVIYDLIVARSVYKEKKHALDTRETRELVQISQSHCRFIAI